MVNCLCAATGINITALKIRAVLRSVIQRMCESVSGLRPLPFLFLYLLFIPGCRLRVSGGGYFHEVTDSVDHAHYTGSILFDNCVIHFVKAECVESTFLYCGAFDAAFYLFDFYLCHIGFKLYVLG